MERGIVGAVVLLIGAVPATLLLPAIWRHELKALDIRQPWWLFDDESWHAFLRVMPLGIATAWLIAGIVMLAPILPHEPPASMFWAVPAAGALLAIFLLICTIWFWNRPKFLVPPHLRAEPGTFSGITRSGRRPRSG